MKCPEDEDMIPPHVEEARKVLREWARQELVDRFLAWPLPKSVCADMCATDSNYQFPRSGTNLLSAIEARQMLDYLLGEPDFSPSAGPKP